MPQNKDFLESLIRRYERYIAPFTFVAGFIFDTLTLRRIDFWLDHVVLLLYLLVAVFSIMALNAYESGRLNFRGLSHAIPFVPIVMQFAFGGLFSAFVIFYTKGASLATSWGFLLVLIFLLIGNERFRRQYQRFVFQMSMLFFVLYLYTVFALPIVFMRMGTDIFLLSGMVSLGAIALFIKLFFWLTPQVAEKAKRTLFLSILGIYVAFTGAYFLKIIPPAPLSLKESGVYHSVIETNGEFHVRFEPAAWYAPFSETSSVYHWKPGERVYFFSSVFAPTKLSTGIIHRWSYYDPKTHSWRVKESIRFPVVGGRDRGYRGYSYKTAVALGTWRVEIVTDTGHVLGQKIFTIINRTEPFPIVESVK